MIRALRSAARGPAVISALAATALTGLVSQPVLAHAVGKPFQSPIPLWMQLAGAGIAVAASFVVSAAIVTVGTDEPRYPHLAIPLLPSLVVQWLLDTGAVVPNPRRGEWQPSLYRPGPHVHTDEQVTRRSRLASSARIRIGNAERK